MRSLAGEVKKANKEVCNRPVRAIQFVEIELRPRSRMRDLRKLKLQYVGTAGSPVRLLLLERCCTASSSPFRWPPLARQDDESRLIDSSSKICASSVIVVAAIVC